MNWPTYTFSEKSEPELLEFFKVVANQTPEPVPVELKELWEQVLPMDNGILEKIASVKSSKVVECLEINDSDGEDVLNEIRLSTQNDQLASNIASTSTDDFVDGVKELLEGEDILSEDVIKNMAIYLPDQLEEIFISLSNDLNSQSVWKLWKSISNSKCIERDLVTSYFSKYILTQKMLTNDHIVEELLQEMFETLPCVVSTTLANGLVNMDVKDLTIIRKHIQELPDGYRNILLKQFLKTCTTLQAQHIPSISCLVSKCSDADNLNIITELMYKNAKEFSSDKNFGKLIIDIVSILGNRIISYESHLKHVITIHKSIYESQARKMFENCLNEQRLNSSLSYIGM
ncbi:hypothetical protein RI129_003646 [Pyrocoelia pectoralis]|uniref:Fanconi Anaemia group E protein C-terminal domain-containing protein n=1 Tax=Pyrocoelia pectoralis TaxID=417401 RepID=A0AAN7VS96_9COLE